MQPINPFEQLLQIWKVDKLEESTEINKKLKPKSAPMRRYGTGRSFYFVLNASKKVLEFCSKGIEELLGYTFEEAQETGGGFIVDLVHPHDVAEVNRQSQLASSFYYSQKISDRKKITFNFYTRICRKDNKTIYIQNQLVPLQLNKEGMPLVLLFIWTDVSHISPKQEVLATALHIQSNEFWILSPSDDTFYSSQIFSNREREILKMVSQGLTSRDISSALKLSYHTVRTHRRNMLAKIHKRSTAELVQFANRHGII